MQDSFFPLSLTPLACDMCGKLQIIASDKKQRKRVGIVMRKLNLTLIDVYFPSFSLVPLLSNAICIFTKPTVYSNINYVFAIILLKYMFNIILLLLKYIINASTRVKPEKMNRWRGSPKTRRSAVNKAGLEMDKIKVSPTSSLIPVTCLVTPLHLQSPFQPFLLRFLSVALLSCHFNFLLL